MNMEFGEGWAVVEYHCLTDYEVHVIPIGEQHEYMNCPCHPVPDIETPTTILHNSFDGREDYELGIRKVH